jgi:beta-N-acetylhexosaminidase
MVLILTVLLSLCPMFASDRIDQVSVKLTDPKAIEKQAEKILHGLTLEQKVGQMFLYGFQGKQFDDDARHLLHEYRPGGFIIFTRNIGSEAQLVSLNSDIKKVSTKQLGIPAFIAIDQEGGKVLRIKNFGTVLPGNMNLGATRSSALSFLAGKLTAIDLEMLGINMNLAPVMDVNSNAKNEVIGVRSFGDDPDMVSLLGAAYIRGIQSRRVSATAKHFPGHGNTTGDSHFETPVLERSEQELNDMDLKPFVSAINDGVDAIMTAHIAVPSIDPSKKPATLSSKIITGLLREKMGYNGLVISDDMEMRAVTGDEGIGKATVEAVQAGCDVITIVWTNSAKKESYNALLTAVKKGLISAQRIDESVKRILTVKLRRKLFEATGDPKIEEVRRIVGNKLHQQISHLIAQKSITLVKNYSNTIPVKTKGRFVVISPFSYLSSELKNYGLNNLFLRVNVKMKKSERQAVLYDALQMSDAVVGYIVGAVDESQALLGNELKKKTKKPVIVASLDSPYMYSSVKNADAYLCSYSFRSQAIQALARVITGDAEAVGTLPVDLGTKSPVL